MSAFLTLALSWAGLVMTPQLQLGRLEPVPQPAPQPDYPTGRPGLAQQGLQVYRSLGCAECHTQQVRPEGDLERGWGVRRTVAQDFLADRPVLVGNLRMGPDLANLAMREPARFAVPWKFLTDSNHVEELERRLYLHLYNPRQLAPASVMPAYAFLFERRPLRPGQEADPLALQVNQPGPGRWLEQIVPGPRARALMAYLLSLRADAPVFEAPLPGAAEAAAAAGKTNQVNQAGGTNAVPPSAVNSSTP
ncbi:cbb3-type cytochrome c oxidase subunit II [Fontisphaera persica]|uniref:cbb3-type cytochrome c oxidase subunit II n=1 Tax=Fontisphaera persica TaxID=2974023 RepID=UPI0024C0120E|nr:cbb3-type cytochrome c oxidase subunit II [Fontisphaera persica]WCJ57825.1 cbb3-type cytochrome c oxidase subunit II [Fontisphaera persica]